jgi:hypothetical protein
MSLPRLNQRLCTPYVLPSASAPSIVLVPPSVPFLFGFQSPWNSPEQNGAQGRPEYQPASTKFPFVFLNTSAKLLQYGNKDQGLPARMLPALLSVPEWMVITTESKRVVIIIIIRDSDDRKVIIIGSCTTTASEPETTIVGHTVKFVEDTLALDGTSTYHFLVASPAVTSTRNARP